jgi:hypothetical protein
MHFVGKRPQMAAWAKKKLRRGGTNALVEYQREKNAVNIDGLPALDPPTD